MGRTQPAHLLGEQPRWRVQLQAHGVKYSICSRKKLGGKRPADVDLTLKVSAEVCQLDPNHNTLVFKKSTLLKINCSVILLVANIIQKTNKQEANRKRNTSSVQKT